MKKIILSLICIIGIISCEKKDIDSSFNFKYSEPKITHNGSSKIVSVSVTNMNDIDANAIIWFQLDTDEKIKKEVLIEGGVNNNVLHEFSNLVYYPHVINVYENDGVTQIGNTIYIGVYINNVVSTPTDS